MRGDSSDFRQALLGWFDTHRRDLPWRSDPSLYKTVVSEFMLQQTQVETVRPYFTRWIKRFPGFAQLARAREETVLKLWEGLGYYSRARNLHRLAKSIVSEGVPGSRDEWLKRPGVGPYTAAAIASIAQSFPEPVIDGNVVRVLARLQNDGAPIRSASEARKRFLSLARELVDPVRPGDFNEALMELGATVCRKVRPDCLLCPVMSHCSARAAGSEESLPVMVRKPTTSRTVHRVWTVHHGALLLHFHPADATRLAGLAELPALQSPPEGDPLLTRTRGISSERVRESIHRLSRSHPLVRKCRDHGKTRWIPLPHLDRITLSAPHRRWIHEILRNEAAERDY